MESRMTKYNNGELLSRSKKNEKLYQDISGQISEFDSLPIPDNSNEIDINGLKEIISSRDEYRKNKENRLNKSFDIDTRDYLSKEDSNKIYDINVLLENAKNEINKSAEVTNDKKINTNFLTSLEEEDSLPPIDDAMEISNPISNNTSSNTDSLPLDILADLKGNDDTKVTDPIVKDEVTMIRKVKDGETFYSGSFSFSKKDFEEDDEKLFEEKSHNGIKVFFIVSSILALIVALYFVITKYVL